MKLKYFLLISAMASILFYSCRREDEIAQWNTNILAPLVHSSMTIGNLVGDTLITKNIDSSLSIVYKNSLYKTTIDSLFVIPDTFATSNAKLQTLKLADVPFAFKITLGAIIRQIPFGPFLFPHGSTKTIPAATAVKSPDMDINGGQYFETMTLKDGAINMKIKNGLPVDLTDLTFNVNNKSDQSLIATGTFPIIKAGDSATKIISLAGKTINKNMVGNFVLSTPGSGSTPVKIDTNNAIVADMKIVNIKPSSATAIFPKQNIIDTVKAIALNLTPVQLSLVKLRKGDVLMKASSTLQDSLYLHYEIPSATKNNEPFVKDFVIPPAPPNSSSSLDLVFDFTGYDLDLKGQKGTDFNTLYTVIRARIDSTGKIKTISLTDSIYFDVRFKKLLPNYALGYLGQKTVNIKSSTNINLFKSVSAQSLTFNDVKFNLNIENGIGLEGSLAINDIKATNTRNNSTLVLTGSAIKSYPVKPATDKPITSTDNNIVLDNTNSNINEFFNLLPDKLDYSLKIDINPNGNTSNSQDFVYYGSSIDANLNMEIPLYLAASKLLLKDTVDFEFGTSTALDKVNGGQLTLLSDNGFPFEANIQIYLLDGNFNKTESLLSYGKIDAAPVNGKNKVISKKRSKLIIPIDENKVAKLKSAKKILVEADFSTIPDNTPLKIYSDYSIDFKLIGDFKYIIK